MSPVSAITAALLLSLPAASMAQGTVAVECADAAVARDRVTFDLDFNRQAVSGAFPISWAWFAPGSVLFGHGVLINGDYHTTQSYTFDRATGMLEACDFATGGEQACGRRQCSTSQGDYRR